MEWIARLQGKVVGLDTAPLIYFMERNPKYIEMMRLFFKSFDRGDFRLVTSTVTLFRSASSSPATKKHYLGSRIS